MNELMQNVLSAVRSCDVDRLPRVLGMLAEISETCRARLAGAGTPAQTPDELLTISQQLNGCRYPMPTCTKTRAFRSARSWGAVCDSARTG